ncbi:PAS domain S-box protein, partial [Salmonella enterica]
MNGEANHAVAQILDISQRKAYEEALFRERELAEVTLRSIGDAVITTDLQHRVTSLNPIAEAMTGWSQAEAVGRPMSEVFR